MKKILNNKLNSFLNDGYCIVDIFNKSNLEELKRKIKIKINKSLKSKSLKIKELKNYHKIIDNNLHSNIIDSSKRYIGLNKSYQNIILKISLLIIFVKTIGVMSKKKLLGWLL